MNYNDTETGCVVDKDLFLNVKSDHISATDDDK